MVKAKRESIVKQGRRRWWLVGLGLVSAVLTIIMLVLYSQDRQNYLSVVGFLLFAGGAAAGIYFGLRRPEEMQVIGPEGMKRKSGPFIPPNSINIYIEKNEEGKPVPGAILFEYLRNPKGHPHQVINDSRWYYVHYKLPGQQYRPYTLSDMQYFDPGEMGRVLTMPAHRDLFAYSPSLLQKLQPWLLVAGIGIVGLIMVILSGSE